VTHCVPEKIGQDRLFATANINVIWDSAVEEFLGSDSPPHLLARDSKI